MDGCDFLSAVLFGVLKGEPAQSLSAGVCDDLQALHHTRDILMLQHGVLTC